MAIGPMGSNNHFLNNVDPEMNNVIGDDIMWTGDDIKLIEQGSPVFFVSL